MSDLFRLKLRRAGAAVCAVVLVLWAGAARRSRLSHAGADHLSG